MTCKCNKSKVIPFVNYESSESGDTMISVDAGDTMLMLTHINLQMNENR